MSDDDSATQMMFFIIESLFGSSAYPLNEYETGANPIAFGVFSWTLGAFYWNES